MHYKEFLVVGDERPQLEVGERLCASCFGKADKAAAEKRQLRRFGSQPRMFRILHRLP